MRIILFDFLFEDNLSLSFIRIIINIIKIINITFRNIKQFFSIYMEHIHTSSFSFITVVSIVVFTHSLSKDITFMLTFCVVS